MSFERVMCEKVYTIAIVEIYDSRRCVYDYPYKEYASYDAAATFLLSEGYVKGERNFEKPEAYRVATVSSFLRPIKD